MTLLHKIDGQEIKEVDDVKKKILLVKPKKIGDKAKDWDYKEMAKQPDDLRLKKNRQTA